MPTENNLSKTTKFYNTEILKNKLTDAMNAGRIKYEEQVKREVGDRAEAKNDQRLKTLSIWPQASIEKLEVRCTQGFWGNTYSDTWPTLDTDKQTLITQEDLPGFRVIVYLPVDLSRDVIVEALQKEFGREIKKDDFEALQPGVTKEGVGYRVLSISLDTILNAPSLTQGAARSA